MIDMAAGAKVGDVELEQSHCNGLRGVDPVISDRQVR